jgi:ornithine carbamoyltransferase
MGMHLVVATPPSYRPHPDVAAMARRSAEDHGGTITIVTDAREAAAGADAIYTDVWVSMGEEAKAAQRLRDLAPYQVNAELMALAKPHAVFMHCLPAHRGQEVTAEVIDGPQSIVWQQAANRMPTEQAMLDLLLTGNWAAK